MFAKFFSLFGGKTKFFAAVGAIAVGLEAAGVIPAGSMDAGLKVIEALSTAGVIWGVADKLDRLVK